MIRELFLSTCLALGLIAGCGNKTAKANDNNQETEQVSNWEGNYATESYQERNKGMDWVAVMITKSNKRAYKVKVRSRTDIKRPTCTFDGYATIVAKDTLLCNADGHQILFIKDGHKLTITTKDQKDLDFLRYYCSGGASLAGTYYHINGALETKQMDKTAYNKTLNYGKYSFELRQNKETLTITPMGLTGDARAVQHEIKGKIVGAEVGDLNKDGFPELMVYITLPGAGQYGTVIGYSVNSGKSMSELYFPPVAENSKISQGYLGRDEFAIVENTFAQRFPIYKKEDSRDKPTGGIRQIQYKLVNGEAARKLVVDKVVEY